METLPSLVRDLALILVVAGVTTLIFKRLKQPLVLGYILAGFLAGPHMSYMPSVTDHAGIDTWSEIGVIFIMFTLGLEFSFKKIVKMGIKPVVAALCVMMFMIGVGSTVGHLFGWDSMNSLFLGGMLAMSSTAIIFKSLDELGLRQRKFASIVLSVLVLEDILGILLMVVLSAMAVSQHFAGSELVLSFVKLGVFFAVWFIVGIFLIPTALRRNSKWISGETLLVVSVGLCFLMVVLAVQAGYSSAFGAFMMGSILAETVEAESIEKVVGPVKDLFSAIFFVSVGMLVDPQILVQYAVPILVLTLAVILGQAILGTLAFLISGQSLRIAMQCGFSLAQIGEFAFILAALGHSLGVTHDFLYPIVVAVSIITTFFTPYMMRFAEPAYSFLESHLPDSVALRLSQRPEVQTDTEPGHPWQKMLQRQVMIGGVFLILALTVMTFSLSALLPVSRGIFGHWVGNAVCGILTIGLCSLFLRPIVMKKFGSEQVDIWRTESRQLNYRIFQLTVLVRFALVCSIVYYVLNFLSPARWYWHILASVLITLLFCCENIGFPNPVALLIKRASRQLELIFRDNLHLRERKQESSRPKYAVALSKHDIHLSEVVLPEGSTWGGKTLQELRIGQTDGVLIAAIVRGGQRLHTPRATSRVFPHDKLEVLGNDESLQAFVQRVKTSVAQDQSALAVEPLSVRSVHISALSPLAGLPLSESHIRDRYDCLVVGFESQEEGDDTIEMAQASRVIQVGDRLWVAGDNAALKRLAEIAEKKE
ncbi:MAG: cation:proton antiporter [Alloprevotella sp.]|nr:cation:proton antiporter [Alloprevotella sp.]